MKLSTMKYTVSPLLFLVIALASSGCSDILPISSATIEPEETAVERVLPSPAVTTDRVVTPAEAGATRTAPTPSLPTPIVISPVNTPPTDPEPTETTMASSPTGGATPLSTATTLPITTTAANATTPLPAPTEVGITGVITSETSLDFQVIEARTETNAAGEAQLSLPLNLRSENLQPTVQEIVYLTFANDVAENLVETTFWRANVQDVNNPQQIYSVQHLSFSGPDNPVISPDGTYLVYGLGFNDRTHSMHVALLDIDNGVQETVDDIIINGGAAPRANSQAFVWTTDSQSFIYIKDFADETSSSSEIHQYSLETNRSELLFTENGIISIVGWPDQSIYYLVNELSGPAYPLRSFAIDSGQFQQISTIEGSYANGLIKTSPDRTQALFNNGALVNLRTEVQTQISSPSRLLWLPDSTGFLSEDPIATILPSQPNSQSIDIPLTLKLPASDERLHWVAWSPDGRYLVYRAENEGNDSLHLLDLQSGQTQTFNQPVGVIGWR